MCVFVCVWVSRIKFGCRDPLKCLQVSAGGGFVTLLWRFVTLLVFQNCEHMMCENCDYNVASNSPDPQGLTYDDSRPEHTPLLASICTSTMQ